MIGSARANGDQLSCRKVSQRIPSNFLIAQVAANQTRICLADLDKQLARSMMRHTQYIEALVRFTVAKDWKVEHGRISDCGLRILFFVLSTWFFVFSYLVVVLGPGSKTSNLRSAI